MGLKVIEMNKAPLKKINGILLLDKPLAISSNGALQRVKRLFAAKKAGHTGSLDPLATGMLPICFGDATKFSQYLLDSDKFYRVTATLGVRTATADSEGEITETRGVNGITRACIEQILPQFTGTIEQVPPMYSALKLNGQPLYKLARRGIEVERQARTIEIFKLVLGVVTETTFEMDVHCSKGTYIRTLVDDIGLALGCGAHVSALRRTVVAPYQNQNMLTMAEIEEIHAQQGLDGLLSFLLPLDTALHVLPAVQLTTSAAFYLRMGQPVMASQILTQGPIRIYSADNEFMGLGEMLEDGRVAPRRLLERTA